MEAIYEIDAVRLEGGEVVPLTKEQNEIFIKLMGWKEMDANQNIHEVIILTQDAEDYIHTFREITHIEEVGVYQCNNCGAYVESGTPTVIHHHKSCKSGEAKRWAKFYSENES